MKTNTHDIDDWLAAEGGDEEWKAAVRRLHQRARDRGDIVVVYRNSDFGGPGLGDVKITTYGSAASQLEAAQFPDGPPATLPDIGGEINWRYQLEGELR